MIKGFVGKKIGMTQVFNENGQRIPVTVVEAGPLYVLKVTKKTEGKGHQVNAIEVGFDVVREVKPGLKEKFQEDEFKLTKALRLTSPLLGHIKKAGFEKKFGIVKQIRIENMESVKMGDVLTLKDFEFAKKVNVQGTTKGRGFTGAIKRWGKSTGPNTHGSRYHRGAGSLGNSTTPARVYPGRKIAGQHGNALRTIRNLEVVKVDIERNLLIIKGAIPGANGKYIFVKASS